MRTFLLCSTRAASLAALALTTTACSPRPLPPPTVSDHVASWRAELDWDAAGEEMVDVLSRYLQVRSINPPGDETLAADFMIEVLEAEGIGWELIEFSPGRGSLVARVGGNNTEPPLCLMSHLDVVPAEAQYWPDDRQPFSGAVVDGEIWGRGALDMKGMGAIELMTLVWLKRLNIPLKRDVVLLAVADEEVNNQGAMHMVSQWDRVGCSHLINEGGLGLRDIVVEGQNIYGISNAEKGVFWAQVVAHGEPGHGSVPLPDTSVARLHHAVDDLYKRKQKPEVPDSLMLTLDRAGRQTGGAIGWVLTKPRLVNLLVKPRLLEEPASLALMTDTLNVTGYGGMLQPNVVPSNSIAQLDCRIRPETTPEMMEQEILKILEKHPNTELKILQTGVGVASPLDDPLYEAIANYAVEGEDNAVAGPILSPGFTDSLLIRPLGVHAYGFVPFLLETADTSTMHGHNERVSVENVENGLHKMFSIVVEVAAVPAAD